MCFKNKILKYYRRATSRFRSLPDFLIIGAQKGGTSSLAFYLAQHPGVKLATNKEVHFFDKNYELGINWYKSFFPIKNKNKRFISGEATPFYLFHPHSAQRVKETLPGVKLIILLRNPIDRAFSHYQMQVRKGNEVSTTFEDAIRLETSRTSLHMKMTIEDKAYNNPTLQRFSYLARGKYYEQLKKWITQFDRNQFLFIKSEDFFSDPEGILQEVCRFLNIETFTPDNLTIQNQGGYQPINEEIKEKLINLYKNDIENLSNITGINFNWF